MRKKANIHDSIKSERLESEHRLYIHLWIIPCLPVHVENCSNHQINTGKCPTVTGIWAKICNYAIYNYHSADRTLHFYKPNKEGCYLANKPYNKKLFICAGVDPQHKSFQGIIKTTRSKRICSFSAASRGRGVYECFSPGHATFPWGRSFAPPLSKRCTPALPLAAVILLQHRSCRLLALLLWYLLKISKRAELSMRHLKTEKHCFFFVCVCVSVPHNPTPPPAPSLHVIHTLPPSLSLSARPRLPRPVQVSLLA